MGCGSSVYDQRVTIVGGGFSGAGLAKQLSKSFEVTLVEKDDSFTHIIGAPRGIVVPGFEQRLRLHYSTTVGERGRVVQARATAVREGRVELDNGETLESDYVVVAVGGSGYRSPLRSSRESTSRVEYEAAQREAQKVIEAAPRILVVGGGPTGIEIVGEITETYPDKNVVLVESGSTLLKHIPNLNPKVEPAVRAQLAKLGVELRLGVRVANVPEGNDAVVASPGATYTLSDNSSVQADAIVIATGQANAPPPALALFEKQHLDNRGQIRVNEHLQVAGLQNVLAVGDATNLPEAKTLVNASHHADYVAKEIVARAGGKTNAAYTAKGAMLALVMGAGWGALSMNGWNGPGFLARMFKGRDFMVSRMAKQLGLVPSHQ